MNSDNTKGKYTATAVYMADADQRYHEGSQTSFGEFVDPSSNSDIMVYDNNQWFGYMSSKIKKMHTNLYKAWGMGGITD